MNAPGKTRDAIAALAKQRNLPFADLLATMEGFTPKTVNGVTYTEGDYIAVAPMVEKALGRTPGVTDGSDRPTRLRKFILEKNQLFFHRWRPQNETYLFGFRKGEQGNNGVEIPQFDPLIAAKENLIFEVNK